MDNMLQYAFRDKNLIHISQVGSGANCECYCPSCGGKLIAKKGDVKLHHFAHYNLNECKNCYETSLHYKAKDLISCRKEFKIPEVYLNFPESSKESEKLYESNIIKVDNVYLEKRLDDIIPDIIIESLGKKLLIEIFVTHKVETKKLNKVKKLGISILEINLSEISYDIGEDELEELIINGTGQKRWLFNTVEDRYYKDFKRIAQPFKKMGMSNYCPINKFIWHGRSSVRWVDCFHCEYCFSAGKPPNCLGYSLVAKVADLNKSKEQLQNEYKLKSAKLKDELVEEGYCPKCGNGRLVKRESSYGTFLGCDNYPGCKYTLRGRIL